MYGSTLLSSLLALTAAVAPAVAAPTADDGAILVDVATLVDDGASANVDDDLHRSSQGASHGFVNMVYYTDWSIYARNFPVSSLPADKITHVIYAFLNVRDNGEVFSGDTWADIEKTWPGDESDDPGNNLYGNAKQLYLLKKTNRQLKTLLSVGGWSWSTNFSAAAASEETRDTFAKSSVKLMADWGFDGIDIDWEYPLTETDAANYILLLQTIRDELDSYAAQNTPNYHYQLTVATSAGPLKYGVLDKAALGRILDYVNLMAYDYGGAWDPTSGYLANVYPSESNPTATPFNTDQALKAYLEGGVPAYKICLGMPMYGRGFLNTTGIGQPYSGLGTGTWEAGVWDYKVLPKPGAREHYDSSVIGSYSYDKVTHELISYDTPRVVSKKVAYLKNNGLAGTMFWEASADKTGNESLLFTAYKQQGGDRKLSRAQNQLSYPVSVYDNLKAGMP